MTIGIFISHGKDGAILRYNKHTVAKFYREYEQSITLDPNQYKAYHEYNIANILYENGVNVPKPLGWKTLSIPDSSSPFSLYNKGLSFPAFCMQFINGTTLNTAINLQTYRKAIELRNKEINKVQDLGVVPHDYQHPANTLWCQEEERVYLIDFSTWYIPELVRAK